MKSWIKLFIFFIFLGYLNNAKGQEKFQSLKEFDNDTMAYMKKNYNGGILYSDEKTIGHILEDAEIPFRSYVIAKSKRSIITFVLLFTKPADEIRALYKSGKPAYGVFCNSKLLFKDGENESQLYDLLSSLGTNKILDLNDSSIKILKDIQIKWAWFYDQADWFPGYNIE